MPRKSVDRSQDVAEIMARSAALKWQDVELARAAKINPNTLVRIKKTNRADLPTLRKLESALAAGETASATA